MKKLNSISIEKFSKLALSKKQLNNVRGGEDTAGDGNPPIFPINPPDPRKK